MGINFGTINKVILFGGGNLLLNSVHLSRQHGLDVCVCSAPRHLDETLSATSLSLRTALNAASVPFIEAVDINKSEQLYEWITPTSLGLGFGPAWIFGPRICAAFGSRFVNFMGIRMPQYMGGAHYTWQILRSNRLGAANFQIIEEKVNSGALIFAREYRFHPACHIPEDFFRVAEHEERVIMGEFLAMVGADATFIPRRLDKNFEYFFPSLNTIKQGWVDWSWSGEDIVNFINAFGNPYAGASTTFGGGRVYLHDASFEPGEGRFHPFQTGMIYRNTQLGLFVAATTGAVVINQVLGSEQKPLALATFKKGRRFLTSLAQLEEARTFDAVYTGKGLRE